MNTRRFQAFLLAFLTMSAFVASSFADDELTRFEFSEQKMGVPVSVILYAGSPEKAQEAVDAVWKRFDELNDVLSDWDPESEIVRVCRTSGESGESVAVSNELRHALEESRRYCE